jgi:FkbM family methyltransferase
LVKKWVENVFNISILITQKSSRIFATKSDIGFWYAGNIFDSADIVYGIIRNGLVEKRETELVQDILNIQEKEGGVTFYDIGANTGYYSVLAGSRSPINTVYSFEPITECLSILEENKCINGLSSMHIFPFALSNKEASVEIAFAGSGSTLVENFSGRIKKKDRRIVRSAKLDDIVQTEKLNPPHFIKIDVEGHELLVFKGAEQTIKSHLPVLFVEIVYSLNNLGRPFINKYFEETFAFLKSCGYESYSTENKTLTPFNTPQKIDGIHMYLFLHPSAHKNIYTGIIK